MKKLLSILLCLIFITAYSQSVFESEADVLLYLSTKGSFTNKEANVTLTFSDMGGRVSSGSRSYFNPEVTLISSTRAALEYQSLSNPDVTVKFIVDLKENVIMDSRDGSIFKAYSFEEKRSQEKTVIQPVKETPKSKVFGKCKFNYEKDQPKYTTIIGSMKVYHNGDLKKKSINGIYDLWTCSGIVWVIFDKKDAAERNKFNSGTVQICYNF